MKSKILMMLILFSTIIAQTSEQEDIKWSTLADSPWPMIKHDPQLTGRSPYKGPQTPNIIWEAYLPHAIYSGPVIGTEGNLYFGSYYNGADLFYSYSTAGEQIWDYSSGTEEPPQAGILIDSSNTIYFGSLDGYFYSLNPNGTLNWKYNSGYPIYERTYPNIDLNNNLYFTNAKGELFSISQKGELNWKYMIESESGFYGNSAAISPDSKTIYICGYDSNLYAIDTSGTLKWEFKSNKIWFAPILDSDGNLYFSPDKDTTVNMCSITPKGKIRWEYNHPNRRQVNTYSIPTIDYSGNIFFIGFDTLETYNKSLISLDYYGNYRWQYVFDEFDYFTQPLICDKEGTVYLGDTFGKWFAAISNNGELKWKIDMYGHDVDNTCAIAEDGTLYLGIHGGDRNEFRNNLIAIRDSIATSVSIKGPIINYNLSQNFPNPFNPNTTIKYTIPSTNFISNPQRGERSLFSNKSKISHSVRNDDISVTLKVYDLLGREATILVNEKKSPGDYEVSFNASQLSSGMYFYELRSGNFRSVKKMMLLK